MIIFKQIFTRAYTPSQNAMYLMRQSAPAKRIIEYIKSNDVNMVHTISSLAGHLALTIPTVQRWTVAFERRSILIRENKYFNPARYRINVKMFPELTQS